MHIVKKLFEQKLFSEEQVLEKLENFCAYQERCVADVKKKLYQLKIDVVDYDKYINHLLENNFLNEERFVERFTHGKLNIKNWGKHKIIYQLKQKNIDDKKIEKEINEIDDTIYLHKLELIIQKKNNILKESDVYKKKQKLIIYAQQKGFELDLILRTIHKLKIE